MEIYAIHILEFTLEKIPTDSDKIRQTRAKQVLPPKPKTEKRKNRFHNTVYFLLFLFRKSSIL